MDYSYYNPYLPNNAYELIDYIGSENIFKLVFGNIPLEGKFTSPFRQDSSAGCFFWEAPESGFLIFTDYGDPHKTHYNAIEFIQKYYKFNSLIETVKFIKDKFRNYRPNSGNLKLAVDTPIDKVVSTKEKKIIKLYPRNWNIKDKNFWSPYGITRQQLIDDGVIPIEYYQIYIGENFKTYVPFTPTYGYTFPQPGIVKIYSPYEEDFKWYTNADNNVIGNIENIDPSGDLLIITKSYKDCRVLRNLGYKNVIWFQGETQIPRIDLLLNIIKNYDKVVIFYDNDETGLVRSEKLKNFINNLMDKPKAYSINIPIEESKTKDISDYYEKHREQKTIQLIKKIIKNVK